MYSVYCDGILLFDDGVNDLILSDLRLEMELNKTGSFTFTIYPDHAAYSLIKKLKSIITVYQDGSLLFKGRVLDDEIGFYNEKQVICEGELAFLLDSIQRPYDYSGTLAGYFTMLIEQHNTQVEESKRFTVGNITVEQVTASFSRKETDYLNTWDSIQKKLIETHGGYIVIRHSGNVNYIDYVADFSVLSTQKITFGKNLIDMKLKRSGEDIATAIIPLGAKIEESDERLTIKSVNNDVDYVSDEEAVENFGTIFKTIVFDDISSASDLLSKGKEYLSQQVSIVNSLELSAADLASIDKTVNSFRIGTYVRVTTEPHSIDQNFLVDKISINLLNPADNKLTLGTRFMTLTENISNVANNKIYEIEKLISSERTDDIQRLTELESRMNSAIQQNADSILQTVSEEYYLKDSADALVESINTRFTQTSTEFEFQFNTLSQNIDDVAAGADAEFTEIKKYIRFEDGNIILGESGNELTLRIENDRISFLDDNLEVAYFSNNKLYVTDGEFLNSLQLGKFAFFPRSNGNMSFGKVVS